MLLPDVRPSLPKVEITYFNLHFHFLEPATISWFKLRKCGVLCSAFFSSRHLVLSFLVGKVWIKGCNPQSAPSPLSQPVNFRDGSFSYWHRKTFHSILKLAQSPALFDARKTLPWVLHYSFQAEHHRLQIKILALWSKSCGGVSRRCRGEASEGLFPLWRLLDLGCHTSSYRKRLLISKRGGCSSSITQNYFFVLKSGLNGKEERRDD